MKARYTIGHKVYDPDAVDDFGVPVPGWADPVDLVVYGIGPGMSQANPEPVPGRTAIVTGLQVFVPPGAALGPRDRYVIDGEEWEQDGDDLDYTRSPFPQRADSYVRRGLVLNLKRVEG